MVAAQLPREILDLIFEDVDCRKDLLAGTKLCRAWSVPASEHLHRIEHRRAVNWAIVKKDNALLDHVVHVKNTCFALEDLSLAIMVDNNFAAEAMLRNDGLLLEWKKGHLREREGPSGRGSWERKRAYRERDIYGRPPLVAAVARRNKHLVRLILETVPGINHDVPDRLKHTPLILACTNEQETLDKLTWEYLWAILDQKLHSETQQHLSSPPLTPDLDIVRLLVEAGHRLDPPSYINLLTSGWRTGVKTEVATQQPSSRRLPLYLASCAGNIPLIQLLLSLGAAPDGKGRWDTNDLRPLMGAASVPGNVEAVRVLLKGGADPLKAGFRVVGSALHVAADAEIAAELLAAGVPIDYCSSIWRQEPCVTPLAAAIHAPRLDMALFLLGKGARASCTDYARYPVIRTAVYRNLPELIPALVAKGTSPYGGGNDIAAQSAWCLREIAVTMDRVAVVEQMLALGVDFERRMPQSGDHREERPRDYRPICCVRSVEMLDLIAGCSGDLNERIGDKGETVFLQAMRSRGRASEEERRGIVKRFVELGADINAVDDNGQTALHKAVRFSDEVTADELIRRGQDVNKPDNAGWTPLMLACRREHVQMFSMLMEHGADIHATMVAEEKWKEGAVETALDMALERCFTWGVKRLLEAGADMVAARNYPSDSVRQMIRWKLPALGYWLN